MNVMIFFVVLMAYIVFDLIVKLADQTRKFELYEKALKSEIIELNEKIENLHNDIDMLLQGHHESLADMKEIKKVAAERKKIVIKTASTVTLLTHSVAEHEYDLNVVLRQGNAVKEENENLRKDFDRLQLQQENAMIKMDAFSDYSKTNDDTLKDLHNDMDFLLQSQREQETRMNDLMRQGKAVKEENENLRKELDRLQLQQENAKIKMDDFSDYSKTNDDTLKDMKEGFLFFKDELRDTLKEIQRLLNQVTKMDEEIGKLGENYEDVSDKLERLQNGRYG